MGRIGFATLLQQAFGFETLVDLGRNPQLKKPYITTQGTLYYKQSSALLSAFSDGVEHKYPAGAQAGALFRSGYFAERRAEYVITTQQARRLCSRRQFAYMWTGCPR